MKLAQRIAINFYKTKINALAVISPIKAVEFAFKIFCTPYSGKPLRAEPTSFLEAQKVGIQFEGLTLRGWHWQPKEANGKKILINHGFDSYSYRFEKYVQPLLKAGFDVFAYDAPAHGISDGKTINALLYSQSIVKFNEVFGDFYGIIAHSIGGLAASLAAEHLPKLQKLVLIAPAVETTTAITNFIKHFGLSDDLKTELTNYIVDFSKMPISYFATSTAVQKITTPTLWLHDTEDLICTFDDVKPVKKMYLPHIQFYITTGLGHSKIYRESKTIKTIINFLKK